ncbi:Planctomycete cytochrome C [Rubripirellula obstinata]|uniref:Planctomycete cytochrome C n=1 Tax=Rubripirellula obstinata TaxID=406547 RepID=A0A5B1CIJ9_9BACT|nr:PSD1 and planctomycete cytochrome C domain-containing protein [Rubripirellula obstinata]KAA1260091.1 Planctomycete cytochrome C [Rubripirellula obstinata]
MIRFILVTILSAGLWLAPSLLITAAAEAPEASKDLSFKRDVRPILSNHCFACHGPDENHRAAGVRLDVADEVDLDEVLDRIQSDDPDIVMPPPEMNKPLSPAKVETLARWIEDGAEYEQHWAYVPPSATEPPIVNLPKNTADSDVSISNEWTKNPIDRFALARMQSEDLHPSPRADKRTLIRRATFDLTGLPPTVNEINDFLADTSDDAFPNLVERLIAKPAFGEHLARYWLDLVRFADTNGLHHDHYREMSPYRDWVIRSFNENKPFDQFIKDQIAGDLNDDPTREQLIASGFNRLHLIIDVGTALPEESAFRNMVDQVSAVGTAMMGLTMQCAVCHDHKYDPITQKDFYQMSAFFNNFDGEPETGRRGSSDFPRGIQPPYINLCTPEQDAEIERLEEAVRVARAAEKAIRNKAESSKVDQDDENIITKEEADSLIEALEPTLKEVIEARDSFLSQIPAAMIMKDHDDVRPAHIMVRGAYDQPGEEVTTGTPDFLPPMPETDARKTRMDLADWLIDPSNPLTARVAVNRFWQQLFGVGLVKTSEDFGSQGESPSHPELLDFLTVRFVESGWDVKSLLRQIVLTQTYQQSSRADQRQFVEDPDNRLLARGSRYRLDAEMVRDQVFSVCGLLNTSMYGKSVKPPQPKGLWKIVSMPSSYPSTFTADTGDAIYRRSLYTFWKRGFAPPQLTIFDAPTRESCIARRERTNTPLQALMMMNEEQFFAAEMYLAKQLLDQSELTSEERIVLAYETVTSQIPSQITREELDLGLQQFRAAFEQQPVLAEEMIAGAGKSAMQAGESIANAIKIDAPQEQVELAAWTMLVHSLLNLDITKTRE